MQRNPASGVLADVTTIDALDWNAAATRLDDAGYAVLPEALAAGRCDAIAVALRRRRGLPQYRADAGARLWSRRVPLLSLPVACRDRRLAGDVYAHLAPLAKAWNERLGRPERYPPALDAYLDRCLAAGQRRPTPLLLKYVAGDYNRLHQNVYGELAFPLQATIFLSDRGGFSGGETVLTMQRPRLQSRAEVIVPQRGDLLVFANRYRPVPSAHGFSRENVRHGVSAVHSGVRYALGIIFHDAT